MELYEGPVRVPWATEPGEGRFYCSWSPRATIRFTAEFDPQHLTEDPPLTEGSVYLVERGESAQVFLTSSNSRSNAPFVVSGFVTRTLLGSAAAPLRSIRFVVPNFIDDFGGAGGLAEGGSHWRGAHQLEAAGWRVVLHLRRDSKDIYSHLKHTEAYDVTHIGEITRADNATFAWSDGEEILSGLQYLLSFVRGRLTSPWIAVGYNDHDERVIEEWLPRHVDGWRGSAGRWFPAHDQHALEMIATPFIEQWLSHHSEAIQHLIADYTLANGDGMVEPRVMTSFSGMLLLGWLVLVQDAQTRRWSAKQFKNDVRATEIIRTLLQQAGISVDIPQQLTQLVQLAQEENWIDGPAALAGLRNRIAHPRPRQGRLGTKVPAWGDAWKLSQWYLGLLLLWWFGYHGHYLSTLEPKHDWDSELVPWAIHAQQ